MYLPQERDVILVPLGVYEALRVIQQEKQDFQAGIQTYLNTKQELTTFSKSKLATSQKKAQDALTTSPKSTRILLNLATHLEMQDNLVDAITHLKKVEENNPNQHPEVYVRLALLYERQGDYAKALECYKERPKRLEQRLDKVAKPRPVLLLRRAPQGYRNLPSDYSCFLCCGISSSQEAHNRYIKDFDEKVNQNDDKLSLRTESIIRLGFLEWVPVPPLKDKNQGYLGSITPDRQKHLMDNLKQYLDRNIKFPWLKTHYQENLWTQKP